METKTKLKILKIALLSLMVTTLIFIWFVAPYLLGVSRSPFEYHKFKRAIANGEMVIQSRDTSMFDREEILLKNVTTMERYKIYHRFAKKKEFDYNQEECYEMLRDVDGNFICYKDDDIDVLDFLRKK